MLSKEASSTIFWVFGMSRPGIEPRSPGPLANTLTARPMAPWLQDQLHSIDTVSSSKWYMHLCIGGKSSDAHDDADDTHTHTYIYIYIYIYVQLCSYVFLISFLFCKGWCTNILPYIYIYIYIYREREREGGIWIIYSNELLHSPSLKFRDQKVVLIAF